MWRLLVVTYDSCFVEIVDWHLAVTHSDYIEKKLKNVKERDGTKMGSSLYKHQIHIHLGLCHVYKLKNDSMQLVIINILPFLHNNGQFELMFSKK